MTTATKPRSPHRKDGPAIIKSGRVNKTRTGDVFERSVPLTRIEAERMAAALATLPGFEGVAALSTKHSRTDNRTWFVRFRRLALASTVGAMQEVRVERALHQSAEMEAFLAGDDPNVPQRWILHRYPESEEFGLYLTTLDSCTCPDRQYRGSTVGACKHMLYLVGYLQSQRRKRTTEERELDARLNGW